MDSQLQFTYILIVLLVISFTFNPFFKKKASKNITSQEYLIINHTLVTILIVIYFIYLLYNNKCDWRCFSKLSKTEYLWAVGSAVIGVAGAIILVSLIKRDEITFFIPNVQALVIIVGAVVGYFLFQESMNIYKGIGILLAAAGVFMMNYGRHYPSVGE